MPRPTFAYTAMPSTRALTRIVAANSRPMISAMPSSVQEATMSAVMKRVYGHAPPLSVTDP